MQQYQQAELQEISRYINISKSSYDQSIYDLLKKLSTKEAQDTLSKTEKNIIMQYLTRLSYEDLWKYVATGNNLVGIELFSRFDKFIETRNIKMLDDFILKRKGLELKFAIPLSEHYYQVPEKTLNTMRKHNNTMLRYKMHPDFVYGFEQYWIKAVQRVKRAPEIIKRNEFSIKNIERLFIHNIIWGGSYKHTDKALISDVIDVLTKRVEYEIKARIFNSHDSIIRCLCNDRYSIHGNIYGFIQQCPDAESRLRSVILNNLESFMATYSGTYYNDLSYSSRLMRQDKEFSRALDNLLAKHPNLFVGIKDGDCMYLDESENAKSNKDVQAVCMKKYSDKQKQKIKQINDDITQSIKNKDTKKLVDALVDMSNMHTFVKIRDDNIKLMNDNIEFLRLSVNPRSVQSDFDRIVQDLRHQGVNLIEKNFSYHIDKYMLDFVKKLDKHDDVISYLMGQEISSKIKKAIQEHLMRIDSRDLVRYYRYNDLVYEALFNRVIALLSSGDEKKIAEEMPVYWYDLKELHLYSDPYYNKKITVPSEIINLIEEYRHIFGDFDIYGCRMWLRDFVGDK